MGLFQINLIKLKRGPSFTLFPLQTVLNVSDTGRITLIKYSTGFDAGAATKVVGPVIENDRVYFFQGSPNIYLIWYRESAKNILKSSGNRGAE